MACLDEGLRFVVGWISCRTWCWILAMDRNCQGSVVIAEVCWTSTLTKTPSRSLQPIYAFGHLSKFVQYDAHRVHTVLNGCNTPASLVFKNLDETGVLIVHNNARKGTSVNVDMFGFVCSRSWAAGPYILSLVYDGTTAVKKWETNYR